MNKILELHKNNVTLVRRLAKAEVKLQKMKTKKRKMLELHRKDM
jgi:hypothetical protein